MSKIRILPDQLANQIAAGEVVERPASVVKELLENSLDAGASRIEVEIEGGGTRLIRIIDNGEGMDEDDVLLSLERHGTSKIHTDKDLTAIGTLGFRGEAIPSIGSVSKMTIISRRADAELGTRAEIQFGKLQKVHEAGCSVGTIFEIKNLFGNTPARKKFLRTVRTELNHIDEVIKNYALANPEITFSLTVNGKRTIYLDNTLSLEERLSQLIHYNGRYICIGDEHATTPERRVYGFLIPPEKLHTGPARLRLFVNGRAIKDRMMTHGVAEGLRGFLMKGKNPAGLIHLILPPSEIDVNVHPAKHEVRFGNSRDIHYLISQAVASAMNNEQRRLQTAMFGHNKPTATTVPVEREQPVENPFSPVPDIQDRKTKNAAPRPTPMFPPSPQMEDRQFSSSEPFIPEPPHDLPAEPPHPGNDIGLFETCEPVPQTERPVAAVSKPQEPAQPASLLPKAPVGHGLQIVGQFSDLYIFCRNSEGLLVIDQHAAHERLLYEELRQQYLGNNVARQTLLFPETVELTLFQVQLVEKHQEEIDHMGFSLREFGGNSFIISAIPALAGQANPTELLNDVLEQFGSESNRRDSGDRIDTILSTMACKAAVKAGTTLSHREIDSLLNRMARANLFSHCPHGRPVVKQFNQNDLKKWFHRT
ncbi:DNA mismatch repair endonuclease MutL [Desulfosediminicola flagellatus]|uniref:DNA mismatch repair endonuclease MutL n=1 Tax=Desulfosediminicola flagellatus TaxID=2569541 RepID=UPI0010AC4CD9|nr:DNA mismatch repair endonuclease MutL [Desulfosediminicola flagellatus]